MIEIPKAKHPGVYALVNLENGKCYVGQTKNLRSRIGQHFGKLKKGEHENKTMQEDYNQGNLFKSVILEEFKAGISSSELNKSETLYINLYQSFKEKHGYNKNVLRLDRNSVIEMVASQEINKLLNDLENEVTKVRNNLKIYKKINK